MKQRKMSKLRYLAAGFFALALSFSSFGVANTASAVDGPVLVSVVAENSGEKSLVFTFSEAVADIEITEDNIDAIFALDNDHSYLDGAGNLGDVDWSNDNKTLTVELSDGTSIPTVAVGDSVTIEGDELQDEDGNEFTGTKVITGSFTLVEDDEDENDDSDDCDEVSTSQDDDSDTDDDCDDNSGNQNKVCNDALKNGKLYKIGTEPTVYLAVKHCVLKPFRGQAAFKARGHKFQDVIVLSAVPTGVKVSGEPALPAEGTLVKGSDATVWFISHEGKRRGFVNADVFTKLGFKFTQVETITDSDLTTMPTDADNIEEETEHPDGAIVKCGNSPEVFRVKDGTRFPFPSIEVFQSRGHSFNHIALVDCGRFGYKAGPTLSVDAE
jgi:hypothetical protein